jgi:hypothetical protein
MADVCRGHAENLQRMIGKPLNPNGFQLNKNKPFAPSTLRDKPRAHQETHEPLKPEFRPRGDFIVKFTANFNEIRPFSKRVRGRVSETRLEPAPLFV